MAKVAFTKIAGVKSIPVKTIKIGDQEIEVKQYLPVEDKLALIQETIVASHDENNFSNPVKLDVFFNLNVVKYYTNISITEKLMETPTKTYDSLQMNCLQLVKEAIPHEELIKLQIDLETMVESIYAYQNSVLGILESISADYSNLSLDAVGIQKAISDPSNMKLLKDVLAKLG